MINTFSVELALSTSSATDSHAVKAAGTVLALPRAGAGEGIAWDMNMMGLAGACCGR